MPAAAERSSRRRATAYRDEAEAAADTAFPLFHAWEMPVDTRLYVPSTAFGSEPLDGVVPPLGLGVDVQPPAALARTEALVARASRRRDDKTATHPSFCRS